MSPAAGAVPLCVVLLEDSSIDAQRVRDCLLQAYPQATLELLSDEEAFIDRLVRGGIDIILCDYRFPGFNGAHALRHVRQAAPDTPFILVSGLIGEENAGEMLRRGATDCVSKSHLERLPAVIERALHDAALRRGGA